MTTKTQSASQPFLRPLRAEASTQIDAAVVRLAIDDERASLRLVSHDHVLAQITDLPTERVDAVHAEAAKHLPAELRNRATRGVPGAALADGHRMLVLLCLHTGLNGPAIVMIRRMLDQPANTFAEWIGVTPETLSRWEQGHRPVNPMAKRSIELAFRALISPSSGTSWVMAGIPEPPVVVSPQRPHLTFAQGHRWLRLLDPLFNEALQP